MSADDAAAVCWTIAVIYLLVALILGWRMRHW